jgi:hypothetical protein
MTADVLDATSQGTQKIKSIHFLVGEVRRLTVNFAQIVGSKGSNVSVGSVTNNSTGISTSGTTATTTTVYTLVTANDAGNHLLEIAGTLQNGEVYSRRWLVKVTDPEDQGLVGDYRD